MEGWIASAGFFFSRFNLESAMLSLFEQLDTDGDGQISKPEFLKVTADMLQRVLETGAQVLELRQRHQRT